MYIYLYWNDQLSRIIKHERKRRREGRRLIAQRPTFSDPRVY
jgi:hypothetical protein